MSYKITGMLLALSAPIAFNNVQAEEAKPLADSRRMLKLQSAPAKQSVKPATGKDNVMLRPQPEPPGKSRLPAIQKQE